jgi:hypothetical protein
VDRVPVGPALTRPGGQRRRQGKSVKSSAKSGKCEPPGPSPPPCASHPSMDWSPSLDETGRTRANSSVQPKRTPPADGGRPR